jgi:hypothetical protein
LQRTVATAKSFIDSRQYYKRIQEGFLLRNTPVNCKFLRSFKNDAGTQTYCAICATGVESVATTVSPTIAVAKKNLIICLPSLSTRHHGERTC